MLAVLLTAGAGACGNDPPPALTSAFDGTWSLTVYGDECGGGPDPLTLAGGRFSGTANLAGTGCAAGAADLDGSVSPGAGEPADFADFGDVHLQASGDPETFYLTGTLTDSGGSGTWAGTNGLEGSFVLLPP